VHCELSLSPVSFEFIAQATAHNDQFVSEVFTMPATLSVSVVFMIAALVILAVSPKASAQVTCQAGQPATYDYNGTHTGAGYVQPLNGGVRCLLNQIRTSAAISSWTYYLKYMSGLASIPASAYIVDQAAGVALASVDISSQLPTAPAPDDAYVPVTAGFTSPVALDPSLTYWLAFCFLGDTGDLKYRFKAMTGDS
jgi:hypothetical protein